MHLKRRLVIGVSTVLVIAAMILPAWSQTVGLHPAAAAPQSAIDASAEAGFPRLHGDSWLDDVPADEQMPYEQRQREILAQWQQAIERRPPTDPAQQAQTVADWTVLVFIAADNNLEVAGLLDINEMEAVGSSERVNIVVEIDRSADWVDYDGDWTEGRRYLIQQDQNPDVITSPVVQNLGEVNSGDPGQVADFAIWGITNYPAEKYMLVLWDHGGAWVSHASDDETGDDITLPELTGALDRIIAETGIDQFEVIGFDMCLMGQLEVFQALAPYARYGLGSEENEPGPGWFYLWLDEVVQNPAMAGAEVGRHVVDYFMAFYRELNRKDLIFGLSAFDLSASAEMATALDSLIDVVTANPDAYLSAIADARNNTIAFGGWDDPQLFDIFSSVDLYQFVDLLGDLAGNEQVSAAVDSVKQAHADYVVYTDAVNLPGAQGLSIYFPRTLRAYKFQGFNERYPVETPPSMDSWVEFLNVFHGVAAETVTDAPNIAVLASYPEIASIYQPAVVTLEVSGRDILQVNYAVALITGENERVVLDFDYLVSRTTTPGGADIVDWSDGVTTRTFAWEPEVPIISDGTNETYALLLPNRENPGVGLVNGEYIAASGSGPIDAQLFFDLETGQSTALWGFNETASGALQPYQIQVQPGDQFRPLLLTLDANNELSDSRPADVTLTLESDTSASFTTVPAPNGDYAISFVAANVADKTALSDVIISVNNEGLDPTLRGYTDTNYGVNFLYPASWLRPRFTPDGLRLFTADLATDTVLSLFPFTTVTSAEETDAAIRASWNALDDLAIQQEQALEINGLPAYVTDYTYTFRGAARVGAVIAIYVPEQGVGYGFDLDAPAETPGPAQAALEALVNSINFFEANLALGESSWKDVTGADGLVTFPVPGDWVQEQSGGFMLYGPANDESVFIGLGTAPASGQSNEQLAEFWLGQVEQGLNNVSVLASEPFYIGNREWYLTVFTYDGDVKTAGAFFVTVAGDQDIVFWLEAPDERFDQLYADVFSVTLGGFVFNG